MINFFSNFIVNLYGQLMEWEWEGIEFCDDVAHPLSFILLNFLLLVCVVSPMRQLQNRTKKGNHDGSNQLNCM